MLDILFRGHTDDSLQHSNVGEYSSGGVANIIECLSHRVNGGDTKLKNQIETCSENVSDISKTLQNELICCCEKFTKNALIKEIITANFQPILRFLTKFVR